MSKPLTPEEDRKLKKAATDRINLLRWRGSNRQLGHLADVENPNRQIRKSDCEQAISGLHRRHDSGRTIAKRVEPGNNAGAAISAMHSDTTFAGRTVSGNGNLVAKLAVALTRAVKKDYGSAAEAKREIRKLLSDEVPARDIKAIAKRLSGESPRNHRVVKTAKAKIGEVALIEKRGATDGEYPFEITADGYFHSGHPDLDRAETAFLVLCAGMN